jgi:hypothetical protein
MTEAKQQEAGRTRFLLLPPLSAAEREAERAEGKLQQSGDRGGMHRVERQGGSQWLMRG